MHRLFAQSTNKDREVFIRTDSCCTRFTSAINIVLTQVAWCACQHAYLAPAYHSLKSGPQTGLMSYLSLIPWIMKMCLITSARERLSKSMKLDLVSETFFDLDFEWCVAPRTISSYVIVMAVRRPANKSAYFQFCLTHQTTRRKLTLSFHCTVCLYSLDWRNNRHVRDGCDWGGCSGGCSWGGCSWGNHIFTRRMLVGKAFRNHLACSMKSSINFCLGIIEVWWIDGTICKIQND